MNNVLGIPFLDNQLLAKSGIKIKKKNRGLFTKYCNGKVTQQCIDKAKRSGNKKLIKKIRIMNYVLGIPFLDKQ